MFRSAVLHFPVSLHLVAVNQCGSGSHLPSILFILNHLHVGSVSMYLICPHTNSLQHISVSVRLLFVLCALMFILSSCSVGLTVALMLFSQLGFILPSYGAQVHPVQNRGVLGSMSLMHNTK